MIGETSLLEYCESTIYSLDPDSLLNIFKCSGIIWEVASLRLVCKKWLELSNRPCLAEHSFQLLSSALHARVKLSSLHLTLDTALIIHTRAKSILNHELDLLGVEIPSFKKFEELDSFIDSVNFVVLFDKYYNISRHTNYSVDQVLKSKALYALDANFNSCFELAELNLAYQAITRIPDAIGMFNKLERICLKENKLHSLPSELNKLTQLKLLEIEGSPLKIIPLVIFSLTNLETLSLKFCQLDHLPEELGLLTNLKNFDISYNSLLKFPNHLTGLGALTTCNITSNRIKALPENFGCLTSLNSLFIEQNKLVTLPESFGNLINLTDLSISHNSFSSLPDSMSQLQQLTTLYMEGKTIPWPFLSFLGKLNLIDLHVDEGQILPQIAENTVVIFR